MTNNQKKVIGQALMQFDEDTAVTEENISKYVDVLSMLNPLTEDQKAEVIRELHSKLEVRIDHGACVKEKNHTPWYNAAKASMNPEFWNRYRIYLQREQGWNNTVLDELDRSTDEIMDLLGNPRQAETFQRRGLCIGDIQSGKTSNYIALINKAADAGYRVIILLTGTIEKLRRQTQGRVDAGFIGFDSTAFTRDNNKDILVGVGRIDPAVSGWAVTSTSSDFNKATAQKIVGKLTAITAPVIFVVKKNKSVLEKLTQWIRLFNVDRSTKTVNLPMLLIDDEADNASVNTNGADNPTAINAAIRKLLHLFEKASYVGFTATPYANIFIDPDSETEMLESDLFPRDFIYALEAPSNYIGATKVFSEDGKYSFILKSNDDCEHYLPIKHKNGSVMKTMPPSLEEAIASFFIANAVRDLRGSTHSHRTMMINVSRFINVQNQITAMVDGYVRHCQREILNYYRSSDAMQFASFRLLKRVYEEHFASLPEVRFSWDEIQCALKNAVMPVVTRSVNGGNASKNLNYEDVEDGLRLIAVGGLSLSRGLTLEGLCVSYFYRNSIMYDTLMQMGRWFGYRSGYEDICQVWMPETSMAWYSDITEATEELRQEIRWMQADNRTPADFGLCVRSDNASLLVTARNKMKTAEDYTVTVSLSGHVIETPYIHSNFATLETNKRATDEFLAKLHKQYPLHRKDSSLAIGIPQYLNVDKADIKEYLELYMSHSMNPHFHTEEIVRLIREDTDGVLSLWDVAVASGSGRTVAFPGMEIKTNLRNFDIRENTKCFRMSGKSSRLGSKTLSKAGLTKEQADKIEQQEKRLSGKAEKFLSHDTYFKSGIQRRPLLVIYPIELFMGKSKSSGNQVDPDKEEIINNAPVPVIGLSIGIPKIDGKEAKSFKYKMNLVKRKELYGLEADEDDFEEVDETIPEEP